MGDILWLYAFKPIAVMIPCSKQRENDPPWGSWWLPKRKECVPGFYVFK